MDEPWKQFQSNSEPVSASAPAESGPWEQFQAPQQEQEQNGQQHSAHGIGEAFQAGMQGSVSGLVGRGRLPDVVLDKQHAKLYEIAASGLGQLFGDAPAMWAGSAIGTAAGAVAGSEVPVVGNVVGGILGGGAGAFAAPAALRSALVQAYKKGQVTSVSDFLSRTSIVIKDAASEALVGALTAGTGKVLKPFGKIVATAGEIGTMTGAPAALHGQLPELEDILNAAILVGGLHGIGNVSGKMLNIYEKTGIRPEQVMADAKADPKLAEELKAPEPVLYVERNAEGNVIAGAHIEGGLEGEELSAKLKESGLDPAKAEPVGAGLSDIPEAYKPAAEAQAAQDAVPGIPAAYGTAAEPFGPMPLSAGENSPTHVNPSTINDETGLVNAINRMADINLAAVQGQRRGNVPHDQTILEANQALANLMGVDGSLLPRLPGTAENAALITARKQIMWVFANDMMAKAKGIAEAGGVVSTDTAAEYQAAVDRTTMAITQFLGGRAELGRGLEALKITKLDADAAQKILDMLSGSGHDAVKAAKLMAGLDSPEGAVRMAKKMRTATTWDQLMEARKAGLLGPVTVIKKSLSEITMLALRPMVDLVAFGLDQLPGGTKTMSAAELFRVIANLRGASEGLAQAYEVMRHEAPADGVTENFRRAIPGTAGTAIRLPFRAIEAGAQLFRCMNERGEAYVLAARMAKAEGFSLLTREFSDRVAELATNPTEEMTQGMEEAGKRFTFQSDLGEFGRRLRSVINTTGPGGVAPLQVVFPFLKSPLNVFKEMARHSPLAPLVGDWRADFSEGGIPRSKAVAEMAVGTALTGLGLSWAAAGKITGSGDPDPAKRRVAQAAGWQPYSIKIGDAWYSYRMIHPAGTLIGMTADIYEMSHLMDQNEGDKAGRVAVNAFAHAITEQTFLQGMTTFVKALDAPEKQGHVFMQNLIASVVPATFTQTAALVHGDPYKRQVDSIKDAVQARIPGLREQLPVQRDPYGEPIPNDERVGGISPIITKIPSQDPVRIEAARLGVGAQAAPKSINLPSGGERDLGKVPLSAEQRDRFGDAAGHLAHQIMTQMMASPAWERTSDVKKQKAFQGAFEKANNYGKAMALTPEERKAEVTRIVQSLSQRLTVEK